MHTTYGDGVFIEIDRQYKGAIIIDDYKLYIKKDSPYIDTYVPLEKITLIKKKVRSMFLQIRPTSISCRNIIIKASSRSIDDIIKELTRKLNLKKKFLKSVWIGEATFK